MSLKRLAVTATIVVSTLVALALFWYLRWAVFLFLTAIVAAAAIRPLPERLIRRGLPETPAMVLTYLFIAFSVLGLAIVSIGPLADDVENLTTDLTETYAQVTGPSSNGGMLHMALGRLLKPTEEIQESIEGAQPTVPVIRLLVGTTVGLVGAIVDSVLVLVLSLYWNMDRVRFERLWLSLLSVKVRGRVREVWHEIENECGAYLRSEFLQGLAAGLLLFIGGKLVGHPYPMLLALIAAIAWLLPWIGGIITLIAVVLLWVPQAILDAGMPLWWTAGPMALYTLVVLSFLEYFVEPKLFDRRRYNALLIILVTVGLADFMGLLGFVLGPPLAASLQIIGRHLFQKQPSGVPETMKAELPLVAKLEQLQQKLSEVPDTPSNLVSLVARLAHLVKDAERSPQTQSIPVTAGRSDQSSPGG